MKRYKRKVFGLLNGYKKAFFAIGILLVIGCICGTLTAFYVGADRLGETYNSLKSIQLSGQVEISGNSKIFLEAFWKYALSFMLIWICGFSKLLIPVAFGGIIYEGFKVGFSSGIVIKILGLKGFLFSGFATFLQSIIFVPVIIMVTVVSVQNALEIKKNRILRNKKYLAGKLPEFCLLLIVSLICGALEGYIVPLVTLKLL